MTFDLEKAREIVDAMSPTPWIVLEDRYGQIDVIRNPDHPMHKEGIIELWGRTSETATPDAIGISYMRSEFPNVLDEIKQLRARDRQAAAAIVAMAEGAKQYVLKTHTIMKNVFDEADSLAGYCEELENIVITKDVRIEELKADLEQSERVIEARLEVIDQQAARIKEQGAEIKRLRANLDESEQIIAHETKSATRWFDELLQVQNGLAQSRRVIDQQAAKILELQKSKNRNMCEERVKKDLQQAARIKELEADVLQKSLLCDSIAENCNSLRNRAWKAEARIEGLEDALVEERARGNHYGMSYGDAVGDGEVERWIIGGEKDLPKIYLDRVRVEAKRQLQAEDKIGPGADAKPHAWQITEERKDVLRFLLSGEFSRDCECEYCRRVLETVRAMLTEAE